MRILRLYLKALCESSGDGDSVRVISLNDGNVNAGDLAAYSDRRLVEWKGCARGKANFCWAALRMGLACDRIVCGHIGQLPIAWIISRLRPGLPYFLVAHGIEVWRPFSPLEQRALRGARRILCVSDYTRRQMLSHCDLGEDRTVVVPNALDPTLEPPRPGKPDDATHLILSISRLTTADNYKGIEHLVAAMPAIRAAVPGARLRVIGRGDGLPALVAQARSLGLEGAVDFAGFIDDAGLGVEFERCRLFALPSQKEGFGLVYLEAMAHGRPCLGARSGGVPEVITEATGVLVGYGDVPGIAAGAISALKRDWSLDALLERARSFSYPRLKAQLESVLSAPEAVRK